MKYINQSNTRKHLTKAGRSLTGEQWGVDYACRLAQGGGQEFIDLAHQLANNAVQGAK